MQPSPKSRLPHAPKLFVAFGLLTFPWFSTPAFGAVVATADPVDGFGESPAIMTVDPFDTGQFTATASRGVAADRRLRQTFQNPATFNVGDITISYNGEPGGVTGMTVRIYQVDDVLASDISQFSPANLFKELTYDGVVPDSASHLRLSLTGASVFSLPARGGESDNLGYAIELSTRFSSPSDPSIGQIIFTNDANNNGYAKGRYYTESGATNDYRDVGLSFLVSTQPTFIPGDTNGDNIVDIETDLQAIAANFRKTVIDIANGDLNGDTVVDFDDFQIWKDNYTGPVPANALAFLKIPEPSALFTAFIAMFGATARRRGVWSR